MLAFPGEGTEGKGTSKILPQDLAEADRAVQFPNAVAVQVDVNEGSEGIEHEDVPSVQKRGRVRGV